MAVPADIAITEYKTTFTEDGTPTMHIAVTFTVSTDPPTVSTIMESYTGLSLADLMYASVQTIQGAGTPADNVAAAILFSNAFITAIMAKLVADGRIPALI